MKLMTLTSRFLNLATGWAVLIVPLQAVEKGDVAKRNPALSYWQAAAQLPALSDAQAKRLGAVADGKEVFDEDVLDGLDFRAATAFLRKAAASEVDCDWGLAAEDGAEMAMPHLSKLRELSTISLVLAEAAFLQGDNESGIEHLWVAHHIARDAAAGASLIGNVVQTAIERRTIQLAARHCMDWNGGERAAYAARLGALPAMQPVWKGFAGEVIMVDWFEREVEQNGGKAAKQLGVSPGEAGAVAEMIADYRRILAEAGEMLKLPGKERRRAASGFEEKVSVSKNPLVRTLMPAITGVIRSEDQVLALQAMLKAALEHGPDIAADDVAGRPFTVTRKDGKLQWLANANGGKLRFVATESDRGSGAQRIDRRWRR